MPFNLSISRWCEDPPIILSRMRWLLAIMAMNIHATSLSWSRKTVKNHLTLERLIGRSSHHVYMERLIGRSASSVKSLLRYPFKVYFFLLLFLSFFYFVLGLLSTHAKRFSLSCEQNYLIKIFSLKVNLIYIFFFIQANKAVIYLLVFLFWLIFMNNLL